MSGGQQIRDYLPVKEVAASLVDILLHPTHTGIVNICSGRNETLSQLVREYIKRQGASIELNLGVHPYPDWEPFRFWGSTQTLNRLRNELS